MTKERFTELWNELDRDTKLQIFNDYCSNYGCDDEVFSFDEDFFNTFFEGKPMDAARACVFGEVNWNDEYVKFDGYGNLESLNEYGVEQLCDDYADTIYEHEDIWKDYIQEEQWREDAEELLDEQFEYEINEGAKQTFIAEHWDEDLTDDENIQAFRKWFMENGFDENGKYKLEEIEDEEEE